jgi:hypothetical protein
METDHEFLKWQMVKTEIMHSTYDDKFYIFTRTENFSIHMTSVNLRRIER